MNRNHNILNWNVRGINSQTRWNDLSRKIEECNCNIICLQETKTESFDHSYIKNFCPRRFNQFAYSPSIGNSGGLITIWNGSLFTSNVLHYDTYEITVKLTSNIDSTVWHVTNIYGPCDEEGRALFTDWLQNLDPYLYELWIVMGDFNLIRGPNDRNRAGGDPNNMLLFNDIIQTLDWEEIPLKGRTFSWSNMQLDPLLEKLDWIFTSSDWTTVYPNTLATPLARLTFDHIPINIQIGTQIPKAQMFRFEEFWLNFDGFLEMTESNWVNNGVFKNYAQDTTARFKSLRHGMKQWSKNLSKLNLLIDNCCYVLALLDGLEDQRPLSILESQFKTALKNHLLKLLEARGLY